MIDSHSHLSDSSFDYDLKEVIEKAKQKLSAVITLSDSFFSNEKNLKISEEYKGFVFSCFGSGPVTTLKEKKLEEVISFIENNYKTMVAVGEVGLDYYWDKQNHDKQKDNFTRFIELANDLNKPIVIHSREAEEDALKMAERGAGAEVIMHSFEAPSFLIKRAVDDGFYVGVTTKAVYSKKAKALIKEIELENMLVETDSPYLNPFNRKERNEPSNVEELVKLVAVEKGISAEEVDKVTSKNAVKAFGLKI